MDWILSSHHTVDKWSGLTLSEVFIYVQHLCPMQKAYKEVHEISYHSKMDVHLDVRTTLRQNQRDENCFCLS